ncbi:MAG: hypothetical protein NWE89_13190 [Candidatus Bathyarchaeota archaeon]|nr:hypothetical protein [Candidatus Bathyarchaeota archaeon]
MSPILGVSILFIILFLVLGLILKQTTLFAEKVFIYETRVADKSKQNSIIYTGVFVPIVIYTLVTREGYKINVDNRAYDSLNIGDHIWVSEYSNGAHKLEPKPVPM